jgi:hypothetical protein
MCVCVVGCTWVQIQAAPLRLPPKTWVCQAVRWTQRVPWEVQRRPRGAWSRLLPPALVPLRRMEPWVVGVAGCVLPPVPQSRGSRRWSLSLDGRLLWWQPCAGFSRTTPPRGTRPGGWLLGTDPCPKRAWARLRGQRPRACARPHLGPVPAWHLLACPACLHQPSATVVAEVVVAVVAAALGLIRVSTLVGGSARGKGRPHPQWLPRPSSWWAWTLTQSARGRRGRGWLWTRGQLRRTSNQPRRRLGVCRHSGRRRWVRELWRGRRRGRRQGRRQGRKQGMRQGRSARGQPHPAPTGAGSGVGGPPVLGSTRRPRPQAGV